MSLGRRVSIVAVLLVAAAAGLWLVLGAGGQARTAYVVVGGVPMDEVHPRVAPGERRPGVVVAHGFAGSARLMAPFGDTLSARGYVVVLLDFDGHGASRRTLPRNDAADTVALQRDLDVAMAHLRSLPDVDPARVALVGHSMGAAAVTRYAAAHPEVAATVAISLPYGGDREADNLSLLVGGLEFPSFHAAAERADELSGPHHAVTTVPAVEHISILFAPRTHRETVAWLDGVFGGPPQPGPLPNPARRVAGAGLLMAALAAGVVPVARLLFGPPTERWPRFDGPLIGRAGGVAGVAAILGALVAPFLPSSRLPLSLGGYVAGLATVTGAVVIAYRWRNGKPEPIRHAFAAPVLIGYAAIAVAIPLHLGLTYAIPGGIRWFLLVAVWAGFAILAYGGERLAEGNGFGVLAVSAVTVVALTAGAVAGLTSSFVLLVVPLLAVLLLWQAAWSAVLHRFAAPRWLIAAAGSLLVAWPIATALPTL
ncbi:alpha/beta hydrolase family protein [Actinoplanes sp. NPDC051513]|uniref:alpha/beta hydrolase family protein n=1 Tax=Actinoplanes sp. NPDC051513 TaxID=3363908 RepID=UPI00379C1631